MVSRWCVFLWVVQPRRETSVCPNMNVDEERAHPLTLGLVLYGDTYLSRVHTTVQCMTMFKGTPTNVYVRLALGLVLYGHTYLSRVHTAVQCMTMFKGTSKTRLSTYFFTPLVIWPIPINPRLMPSKKHTHPIKFISIYFLTPFLSESRLIPLIPLILISIPLKKLTNLTNPINLDL